MNKRIIIITIAVILVNAAAILCLVPRITRFDEVMTAVKLDAKGNELGTATFRVQATKEDFLFQDSRLSCWIPNFDTLSSFERKVDVPLETKDYCFTAIGAMSATRGNYIICDLYGSPELDRWLLWNRNEDIFYVASSDPNATAAELISYFKALSSKIYISIGDTSVTD